MKVDIPTTVSLVVVECCLCGVQFGMTERFDRTRREQHDRFYCPAGHSQIFVGKTEAERLREEKARLTAQLDQERAARAQAEREREAAERRHEKAKRKVARIEKGACPHCNRHFVNVERHMKTKHPAQGAQLERLQKMERANG